MHSIQKKPGLGRAYDDRISQIEGLKQEITRRDQDLRNKQKELDGATGEIRAQLNIRTGQLRSLRTVIVIMALIILGLGYLVFNKILNGSI